MLETNEVTDVLNTSAVYERFKGRSAVGNPEKPIIYLFSMMMN